ncbi:MAG: cell division ATP-binding protein FtsE [Candidatus Gottesmanbacteria bacterium]
MIQLTHVSKDFGGERKALSDISVEISDGEFIFLIGPTGAGKTTFIKLITREVTPTEGQVLVDGEDIATIPESKLYTLRRQVGMVFQDLKLLTDRTVFENIAVGMEVLGKSPEEIEKGVMDVLGLVELADKAQFFPVQLSQGEKQRIALARAIVSGPKILLADEPTGNLDPETSEDILEILKEVNKMGTTVVVVTHNAMLVDSQKKRTITMKEGMVVSDETKGKYHFTKRAQRHEGKHDHKEERKEHEKDD